MPETRCLLATPWWMVRWRSCLFNHFCLVIKRCQEIERLWRWSVEKLPEILENLRGDCTRYEVLLKAINNLISVLYTNGKIIESLYLYVCFLFQRVWNSRQQKFLMVYCRRKLHLRYGLFEMTLIQVMF